VADFYAEVPGGLKDLDPSPVCRVFTSMPSMRRNIDVPQFGPFAGKLRTGTVVMEFVAAPVRQREPSSHADGGEIGGQVGQPVGDQRSEFETCGRQTLPCYQFQGGNAGTPIERDISWLPLRGRSRYRLPSQRPP
jgi:hypothetical protein